MFSIYFYIITGDNFGQLLSEAILVKSKTHCDLQ